MTVIAPVSPRQQLGFRPLSVHGQKRGVRAVVEGAGTVWAWLLLALAVAAFAVVAWRVIAPGVTRPRRVAAGMATLDLGPEPPALVNLLVNGWKLTPAAAPATLLDLAARGYLDLGDPGPEETGWQARCTVRDGHAADRGADPARSGNGTLTAYERHVLDHVATVAGTAGGTTAPTAALTTGAPAAAKAWWEAFTTEVVDDARRRGLSRPPVTVPWERRWLVGAVVAGLAACAAAAWFGAGSAPTLVVALLTLRAVLWMMRAGSRRERDTPDGRAAAANWLGVRDALANDPGLRGLPPSAASLWGRHLAYAAACGVAKPVVRDVLMGADSDRRVWSPAGGRWRQVAVHRPAAVTWGWHPRTVLAFAVVQTVAPLPPLVIAGVLALGLTPEVMGTPARLALAAVTVGGALTTLGGVRLAMRAAAELAKPPRLVEGTVAHLRPGGTAVAHGGGQVAIDDGTGDRATAYEVPEAVFSELRKGAVARLTVGPFFGHVRTLEILTPSTAPPAPAAAAASVTPAERAAAAAPAATATGHASAPAVTGPALTEQDVSQALGWPVQPPTTRPQGAARIYRYVAAAGPPAEVVVTVADNGHADRILTPVAERGWPLTALGEDAEEAFGCHGAVAFRRGPAAVAIRLRGTFAEERSRQILESLATIAASHLDRTTPAHEP